MFIWFSQYFTAICCFYISYLNLLRFLRFEPNFMTFCIDFSRTNCFLIIFLFLFFTNFLIFCWFFIRTSLFLKYFYHIFLYLVSKWCYITPNHHVNPRLLGHAFNQNCVHRMTSHGVGRGQGCLRWLRFHGAYLLYSSYWLILSIY